MKFESNKLEEEGLLAVARQICVAARTAPKGKGIDNLVSCVLTGQEKDRLADPMQKICDEKGIASSGRDAGNVKAPQVIVILGTRIQQLEVPNCGFCGFKDCDENRANNGICAFNTGDLGIAVGSAVSMATDNRVDTRIMFTAGRAALDLEILGEHVKIALGIPLSVSGKSPFSDRK